MGLERKHKYKAIANNGAARTTRPRRIETRPRRARIIERIALGPQTRRRVPFIRLDLVKELLLTLDQELLDGQLGLRVLRVQPAQLRNELRTHAAIFVRELIATRK